MRITVVGAGAWGTALAIALSERHDVALWARSAEQREGLRATRRNRYLPEAVVPARVRIEESQREALERADLALVATPTAGLRQSLSAIRSNHAGLPVVWGCKGLEQSSGRLPHEIAAAEL